ncbi:MAG: hypothetical protein IKL89_03635 [Clostridia bacterium]|nr:hypothetical protein [Clostridia bacterium]
MLSRGIGQFAKENQFQFTGGARAYFGMVGAAYGEYKGFRFTLVHDEREFHKVCRIYMPLAECEDFESRAQRLCADIRGGRVVREVGIEQHMIWVDAWNKIGQIAPDAVEEILDRMCKSAKKLHLHPGCAVCGSPAARFTGYKDVPYYTCEHCGSDLSALHANTTEKKAKRGTRLLRGLFGALLFSLFGLLAWCLMVGFLNKVAAVAGYIIIYGAMKGYLLFGGRLTKFSAVSLLVLSVAVLFGAEYLSLVVVEMLKAAEVGKGGLPMEIFLANAAKNFKTAAVMDIFWGFAFIFAGWCVHLLGVFRKEKNTMGIGAEELI